jgi:hypothetical protein
MRDKLYQALQERIGVAIKQQQTVDTLKGLNPISSIDQVYHLALPIFRDAFGAKALEQCYYNLYGERAFSNEMAQVEAILSQTEQFVLTATNLASKLLNK